MRNRLCRCLIVLLAICLPAAAAAHDDHARIIVDDDGQATFGNCSASAPAATSIQDAVDAPPAGAIIHVCSGVYVEQVKVTKPLTLIGQSEGDQARSVIVQLLASLSISEEV